MKTSKKVLITILIIVCCGIWSYGIMFVNYFVQDEIYDLMFPKSDLDIYAERWDITFPKDAKIEYRYSTQGGFFGEGQNYAIITFSNRPNEFLQSFSTENSQEYKEIYHTLARRLISNGMYDNKLASLGDDVTFKKLDRFNDHDILIMAYDENTNKLYYMEELK